MTAPGLESVTAGEMRAQGFAEIQETPGGVIFGGGRAALRRANLELRTAGRVWLTVARFRAARFDDLRRQASRVAWENFLRPGDGLALRASCHKSRLFHSGAVAERVALAIESHLGWKPETLRERAGEAEDEPGTAGRAQIVLARLERDICTLRVDASGEPLHRRGYRLATGAAPLRETLAAALLLASGWDVATPLVDPFCGSGTLPIEAALLARRRAPGVARRFAFEAWSDHEAVAFEAERASARARADAAPPPPPILASDRDPGALDATRANAERAGVAADLTVAQRALSDLRAPAGRGAIVANPPHGVRLRRGGDLRDLYARLGSVLRERFPGWRVALLSPGPKLWTAAGLDLTPRFTVLHGGLRLVCVTATVPGAA